MNINKLFQNKQQNDAIKGLKEIRNYYKEKAILFDEIIEREEKMFNSKNLDLEEKLDILIEVCELMCQIDELDEKFNKKEEKR